MASQNGHQRTRGSYTKLSAEVKAELGKHAVEKSVAAALRKYVKSIDPSPAIELLKVGVAPYFRTCESLFAKSSFPFIRESLIPRKFPAIRYVRSRACRRCQ